MDQSTALIALAALYLLSKRPGGHSPNAPHASEGVRHDANLTPLTAGQARANIEQVFRSFIMREPSPREVAMLLAHSALETGRWKKMYGWNPGFVTTDGGLDFFELDGNPLKFRWYMTAPLGFEDWMRQLVENWSDAWALIDSDDPQSYVNALQKGRHGSYYGDADPQTYGHTLGLLYREFLVWTSLGPEKKARRALRA